MDVASASQRSKDANWIASLKEKHPHDVADEIRDFPITEIRQIFRQLPDELSADVIAELPLERQVELFEVMRLQRLSGIVSEMFSDDAADVLGQVSAERLREIMSHLSEADAEEIAGLLKYPEDSAGGIMHTDLVSVPEHFTIGAAIEKLRDHETAESEGLFYVYVTDAQQRLRGVVRLRDLLFQKPDRLIRDVMIREVRCVSVHADQEEIARLFQDYHFVALPVVDDFQKLRGVVTVDEVMEVMQEEATEDMQRMVGLSGEEMIETPWGRSVRNRLPWLYVNLATAFLAGWVVSLFEGTIAKYAVLAVFLPIIAGQGGNAGSQTLTIIVRSLALGEMRIENARAVLLKEILIGLMAGVAIGLAVGIVSFVWKGSPVLGFVTGIAMLLNMLAAAVSGVVIPLALKAVKVDPALASAIMLTTVTDVVGFFLFLGLAALGFYYFPM